MNLLTDPVFRIETARGPQTVNLPALLAALGRDEVDALPGLQRHQEDAFHIFLCYLAANVLDRRSTTDPLQEEPFWQEGIRSLTDGDDDTAWNLVVDDGTKPAFMQPPLFREAQAQSLRPNGHTPDELDILSTAKNHDVKAARATAPHPDEWCYARVSLQTMSGFFGRGNYGIARMNSGFASRPCVELQESRRLGARWRRSVRRLRELRSELLSSPWPYSAGGHRLLWMVPWDGETSLSLTVLDPFFIEIARIIRLVEEAGRIIALGKPSKVARIEAKAQKGVLGDPWIPLDRRGDGLTALTVSSKGFTPGLLRRLIFEDGLTPAVMQKPCEDEIGKPLWLYAAVLVRGQGTTDGFHSKRLPIPAKASFALFGGGSERDRLREISRDWLDLASIIQNRVLKPALFSLLEAGPAKVDLDKREVSDWVDQAVRDYAEAWSRDYFDRLWRTLGQEDENQVRLEWLMALEVKARAVLDEAKRRLPEHQSRRYRARVRARSRFTGSLYARFPELKEPRHGQDTA